MTSKITLRFLSLLPREYVSRYFLNLFFMYASLLPVQKKVLLKNLQFLAVTYDMGILSCAFSVVLTVVLFPLFKQFLGTVMTWSQTVIVRECIFKIRTYVSRHVKGLKRNKLNLTSIKKQRKLWLITIFSLSTCVAV